MYLHLNNSQGTNDFLAQVLHTQLLWLCSGYSQTCRKL